jgi:hypothetical protein
MKDTMPRIISHTLLAVLLCAGSACVQLPAVSDIPADYEIEDVRRLPQHFGYNTGFRADRIPDRSCQDRFLEQFTQRYYSPWKGSKPLSNPTRCIKIMKEHAAREWYGENRRKVSRRNLDQILANCDLDRFPSMKRIAVTLVPTSVRVLPTVRPFFATAENFPFDMLQNTGLKMNEPIRVLHLSRDGMWAFVETADANGWVKLRDVGYLDETTAGKRMGTPQAVVVKDMTPIREARGEAAQLAKTGTLFSIMGEGPDTWEVSVPVSSDGGAVREKNMKVPKGAVERFPLELSQENLWLMGNEFIDRPYGWGELFQERDCSSLIRDYFIPFGIWLPRGSYNQIHSGRRVVLSSMDPAQKERYIRENGVPFLTLLGIKGHIMLYIGTANQRPLAFHSLWGVEVRKGDGSVTKHVVGKSIISTLTPGSELPLARSLLDRVDAMLILSDRCPKSDQ